MRSVRADRAELSSSAHVIVTGADGEIRFASPAVRARFGNALERSIRSIRVHLRDLGNDQPASFEFIDALGRIHHARGSVVEIDDAGGTARLYLFRFSDETQPAASSLFVDSDDKYRALVELSPNLIGIVVDEAIVFLNSAGAEILGLSSRSEAVGRRLIDFLDPSEGAFFLSALRSITKGHIATHLPNLNLLVKGRRFEVEVSAVPFSYQDQPAALLTVRDHHRKKDSANGVSQTVSLLSSTLDSGGQALLITDSRQAIVSFNQRFVQMWRGEAEAFKRMKHADFVAHACTHIRDGERFTDRIRQLSESDQVEAVDLIEFRDGRLVERRSSPQRVDGRTVGRVWTFTDITDRRHSEDALRRRDQILHAVAFAAERFLMSSITTENVNAVLARLGAATDVSRVYIFDVVRTEGGRNVARESAEWVADGVRSLIFLDDLQTVDLDHDFSRWFGLLREGAVVQGNVADFPSIERHFLEAMDVQSIVAVPVFVAGVLRSVIGFDDCKGRREWGTVEIEALKTAADIFGAALQRKVSEEALVASEARFRQLFERNLAGVYRNTVDGEVLDCNEACARMFGFDSPADAIRSRATAVYFDVEERTEMIETLKKQKTLTNLEVCYRRIDGTQLWALENVTLVEGLAGEPATLEGTLIDITERKVAEQLIAYQAYHDALTGLPNRLLFRDRLTVAVTRAKELRRNLAILFLDIDHFKIINDTLGHMVGDALLRAVADRLRLQLREEDPVARLGGDEFTMLVTDLESDEEAIEVAQRMLDSFAEPFDVESHRFYVTASLGIAIFPQDGENADTLLKNADSAMYRAKDLGRNNLQLCTPAIVDLAVSRLTMENELRHALSANQLEVYFQPQFDVPADRLIGAEVLVRWQHPERGLIEPSAFIPVAEETRLIHPIGQFVLEQACLFAKQWLELWSQLRFSVNLSARQFQQPDLVGSIVRLLNATGMEASWLELEITETTAMLNVERTLTVLHELTALGISIAIDDFGKGHSSLSYIQRFPIDTLKIDQSFVADLPTRSESEAIVAAILTMARGLKFRAIAEGVENEAQRDTLQRMGCDLMQGYLLARPMPASEFQQFLVDRAARSLS